MRLWQYDREVRANDRVDLLGLTEAATRILEGVQHELHARRESPLEHLVAVELARARKYALEALIHRRDNRYAKEVQARVAPGPALTICVGPSRQRRIVTVAGEVPLSLIGCLRIFEDSPARGRMWPVWCPDCRPRNGKRRPTRDLERVLHFASESSL